MLYCEIRHSVNCVCISDLKVVRVKTLSDHNLFFNLIGRDAVSYCGLGCTLAKLSDFGTRKVNGQFGAEIEGHIRVVWVFLQHTFKILMRELLSVRGM